MENPPKGAKNVPHQRSALRGDQETEQNRTNLKRSKGDRSFVAVNADGSGASPAEGAPQGSPEGSALPCLNSNNSIGAGLTGGHKRTAYALTENVKYLASRFGIERLGFLTLTFRDHVVDIKEAQRRFNSLRSNVLSEHYSASIAVVERQKSGRIHFHLLVVLSQDIRTGFDFAAIAAQDYRSANAALRAEWSFWRQTAHKFGFGRTELMPVKSTAEGIAKYVGKYIAKHMETRDKRDKGARLVRYTADARQVGTRFAWVGIKPTLWRLKTASVAAEFQCIDMEDMKETFGPRWAYNLSGYIMATRLPEGSYPTSAHLAADLAWFSARGYFDQRDEGGGTQLGVPGGLVQRGDSRPWTSEVLTSFKLRGDDPERVACVREGVAEPIPI